MGGAVWPLVVGAALVGGGAGCRSHPGAGTLTVQALRFALCASPGELVATWRMHHLQLGNGQVGGGEGAHDGFGVVALYHIQRDSGAADALYGEGYGGVFQVGAARVDVR
jgi:hypothetical protein